MNNIIKETIANYLIDAANKIRNGQCEIGYEQQQELLKAIAKQPLSKPQAFKFLGISRSKFDYMLRTGQLPQGQKRVGFKELVWYKDELEEYKHLIQDE